MTRETHEKIIRKTAERCGVDSVLAQTIAENAVKSFITVAELELDEPESGVREISNKPAPGPRALERPRAIPPTPDPQAGKRSIILPGDPDFDDPIPITQGRDTTPIRMESLAAQHSRTQSQYNREYWDCGTLAQFILGHAPETIAIHPQGAEDKTIILQRNVLQSPMTKCVKLMYQIPDTQMGGPPVDGQKAQIDLEASAFFFSYDREQPVDAKVSEVISNAAFTFRAREREIISHNPIKAGELTLAAVAESADGDSVVAGREMQERQGRVFNNQLGSGSIAKKMAEDYKQRG